MSVPVWPSRLPQAVLQEGFSVGFGDGRLKTGMDAGPGKSRRRFSAVARPVTASFVIRLDQLPILETFFDEQIAGGALPFFLPDQVHAGLLSDENGVPLLTDTLDTIEVAYMPWLVKIGDQPPVVVPFGALHWRVSFTLMVMP